MPGLIKSASHKDAAAAVAAAGIRHTLLAGPPGVGKTTFAFLMAEYFKQPAWKWQLHAESTPSEGFGMFVPDEKSFKWVPGCIDLAYHTPGVLILDELVEASGPVKTALYGATDDGEGGTMTYLDRTFKPKPGYRVIATMNGYPTDGGLPEALLDRFDAVFVITAPSAQQLALLDPDLRELCEDAYATAPDAMLGPDITFRMFRSYQKLRGVLPMDQAALSACRGNEKLTGTFLEVLALADPEPVVKAAAPAAAAASPILGPTPEGGTVREAGKMLNELEPAPRFKLKPAPKPAAPGLPTREQRLAEARERAQARKAAREQAKRTVMDTVPAATTTAALAGADATDDDWEWE